jgi:hypothetical protein
MSIQQNILHQMKVSRSVFFALAVILNVGLVSCGGGSGGGSTPTDSGPAELTYAGNINPAAITTTNATEIIETLIGGAGLAESVSDVQPQAVAASSARDSVVAAVNTVLTLTRTTTVTGVAGGLDYHTAALVPVDETLPCDSGFISLTGSIDDQNGTGTFTVTFNACTTDGETINGSGTLRVNSMDLVYFEITDALLDFPLVTVSSPEASVSMSFVMQMELFINENRERLTLNLVGQDNNSGDMLKYENFVEENVYYPSVLTPASYTQILRGRMYDSTEGYVDFFVPEVSPLDYSVIEQVYPDTGVLVFTGDNCNLRLVTQSNTHVGVNLDSDGDEVHETGVTLLWDEIGQPVAADIGDNDGDGMHNSWETLYGLDPDDAADALLDSDGDGINNYQEYLDRTDPTAFLDQFFAPSASAAYSGSIDYNPFDPSYVDQAQTFTVGITGQLTSVEVLIGGFNETADLLVDIRPTVNGVPEQDDSAVLGEVVVPGAEVPGYPSTFMDLDFSTQNIQVTSGSVLAIVLKIDRSSQGGYFSWGGETGDLYPLGEAYTRVNAVDWFAPTSGGLTVDFGFKTYVSSSP